MINGWRLRCKLLPTSVDRAFLLKHFIPMQIDCWRMKALVSRKVTLPWQRGESNWRRCWEHWPRRGHQSELVDRLVMESNSVRPISTLSLDFVANRLVGEPRCCRFLYRFPFAAAALLDDLFGCENHYGGSASIHSRPGLLRSCIDVRASSSTNRTQWLLDAAGCRNCAHQKFAGPTSLPQTSFGPRLAPRKIQLYDTIGVARITAKEENAQKTNIGIESGNRNLIYIDDWISKKHCCRPVILLSADLTG